MISPLFLCIYIMNTRTLYISIIPSLQLCIKILQSYKRSNSFYLCARSTREVKLSNRNKTFIWRARSNNVAKTLICNQNFYMGARGLEEEAKTFTCNNDFYSAREV